MLASAGYVIIALYLYVCDDPQKLSATEYRNAEQRAAAAMVLRECGKYGGELEFHYDNAEFPGLLGFTVNCYDEKTVQYSNRFTKRPQELTQ